MREFELFNQILNEAYDGHDVTELLMELLNREIIPSEGLTINTVLEIIKLFNLRTEVSHFDENNKEITESLDNFILNRNIDVSGDFSEMMRTFFLQGYAFRFEQPSDEKHRVGVPNSIVFRDIVISEKKEKKEER